MKRQTGVLMHISSLHGDYSIGSFGKEAREFADLLAESGFSVWQTLPFCMTDECNSPYKSYSAFGANPFFIDLPTLFEKGLLPLLAKPPGHFLADVLVMWSAWKCRPEWNKLKFFRSIWQIILLFQFFIKHLIS